MENESLAYLRSPDYCRRAGEGTDTLENFEGRIEEKPLGWRAPSLPGSHGGSGRAAAIR